MCVRQAESEREIVEGSGGGEERDFVVAVFFFFLTLFLRNPAPRMNSVSLCRAGDS